MSKKLHKLLIYNILKHPLLWFGLLSCFISCKKAPPPLRIATAANMQYVMPELTAAFTQQTGITCETIFSSSGKLTAQIQAGAPYDVFVSADMKYPELLFKKELTTAPVQVYALGKLVLWTTQADLPLDLVTLTLPQIKHIAIANPQTAPYGKAALEVLQRSNVIDFVQSKIVFGESVAQTNQFITTGAAEIGFTAQSVVLAPHLQDRGQWESVDPKYYQSIAQGVCVLKNSKKLVEAEQFAAFLLNNTASEILHTFGYNSPSQSTN
ncbi:MAG: molybdate ABC transporter substrate-binding protein [Saprospiraceae bacterium]